MAETMAVESLVESEWLIQRYLTRTRFPYQTINGGWSDIDVVAYKPETGHLVLAECKARGRKTDVYAFTKDNPQDILKFDNQRLGEPRYFGFVDRAKDAVEALFEKRSFVKSLTVQFVTNYHIARNRVAGAQQTLQGKIGPIAGLAVNVQLDSILDVILRIMKFEEASSQGRRYGNPILDFVREINRYRNPKIHNAATRTAGTQLKQELAAMLSAGFAGHT